MVTLKNSNLEVKINELGAEVKSIYGFDTEYIWEGKREIWGNSCPLLFPICGGLKEDKYTVYGEEYSLPKHGYARNTMFRVESATDTTAVFLHTSNDETKKCFPFDYELRVCYTLSGTSLKIEYRVDNKSDKTMYFSIGSHEGYYTPDGIEDYDVIFDQNETLDTSALYGNLLADKTRRILKDSNTLALYEKYFAIDALVFKNIKSRSAVLRNRRNGKAIKVDFGFAKYFLIWHKPSAPFICLEPWAGIPDTVGSDYDIAKKEGIISLDAAKTYTAEHTITVLA